MKKLCILVFMALPLFGLVWSEDPSLTEEQKEERRQANKRIAATMREIEKEGLGWTGQQIKKDNTQEENSVDLRGWPQSVNDEDTEDDTQEDSD